MSIVASAILEMTMARLRAITGSQWRRIVRIVRKGAFSRRRRDGAGGVTALAACAAGSPKIAQA
jgi:hypothetical protein